MSSEQIIIAAPFSYAGSGARIWRPLRRRANATSNGWAQVGWGALAVTLVALAWTGVTAWYLTFGLLLVPYRLIRRGQRRRKLEDVRHRELLER